MVVLDGATDGKYQVLKRCEVRSSCRSEQLRPYPSYFRPDLKF